MSQMTYEDTPQCPPQQIFLCRFFTAHIYDHQVSFLENDHPWVFVHVEAGTLSKHGRECCEYWIIQRKWNVNRNNISVKRIFQLLKSFMNTWELTSAGLNFVCFVHSASWFEMTKCFYLSWLVLANDITTTIIVSMYVVKSFVWCILPPFLALYSRFIAYCLTLSCNVLFRHAANYFSIWNQNQLQMCIWANIQSTNSDGIHTVHMFIFVLNCSSVPNALLISLNRVICQHETLPLCKMNMNVIYRRDCH